ncbi:K10B2.2 [Symbiodinium sp. CCMP2592]|nr:K10B2.2 [Symbiodinium sp. CCMP2592]
MARANEPPASLQEVQMWEFSLLVQDCFTWEDPAAAFEHAEAGLRVVGKQNALMPVELQLTEFFASPPSSLSLVYLRYVRRLTFLFRWIHVSAECQLGQEP